VKKGAFPFLLAAIVIAGCGRKGPPLPPLIRVPVAPAEIAAERRGSSIDIHFTVPASNTDGSRPANIQRVEVYSIDGSFTESDYELVRKGKRVASIDVKSPGNPESTVEADEPDDEIEPLRGSGLDQGAVARFAEQVDSAAAAPPAEPGEVPKRTYIGVGINLKGRPGPMSKRVTVPLGPAPMSPAIARVASYDEESVTISWSSPDEPDGIKPAFYVYETPSDALAVRLNSTPIQETTYVDRRAAKIIWGVERCFTVSTVHRFEENLAVESIPSAPACVTLADKFPPKAPAGLQAVPSERVVSLIWNENTEPDLAGYLVLRGGTGGEPPTVITPTPITQAHFEDSTAEPGRTSLYVVVAVDKAGNRSQASEPVSGAAR